MQLVDVFSKPVFEAESRTTKIHDVAEVRDILQTHCQHALALYNAGIKFYRGLLKHLPIGGVVDPSTIYRVSRDYDNTFTALLSVLPSWKGYPPRDKSVIFSTTRLLRNYGEVYHVFPFDGDNIVNGDEDDFSLHFGRPQWDVSEMRNALNDFGSLLTSACNNFKVPCSKPERSLLHPRAELIGRIEALHYLDGADKIIARLIASVPKSALETYFDTTNTTRDLWSCSNVLLRGVTQGISFTDSLSEEFSPARNGVTLLNIDTISDIAEVKAAGISVELWTDGNVLLVSQDQIDNVLAPMV